MNESKSRAYLEQYDVPEGVISGLLNYFFRGLHPGRGVEAVLCNDLRTAVSHLDDEALRTLRGVMFFLCNHTPEFAWGSRKRMEKWRRLKQETMVCMMEGVI